LRLTGETLHDQDGAEGSRLIQGGRPTPQASTTVDIAAEQLLRLLTSLFLYVWWGILLSVVLIAVVTAHPRRERLRKRLIGVVLAATFLYLLSTAGTFFVFLGSANARFDSLAGQGLTKLTITTKEGTSEVTEAASVRELLTLLRTEPQVGAHHSHPVNKYQLTFPEVGYVYSLGLDSDVPDEYWLHWDSYPGFRTKVEHIIPLRQVRSAAVTRWLQRHAPNRPGQPAGVEAPR
jgi:hypothetical protein